MKPLVRTSLLVAALAAFIALLTNEAIRRPASDKKGKRQAGTSADDDIQSDLARLQGVWGGYLMGFSHYHGREAVVQPVPTFQRTHRIHGSNWIELGADGQPTGVEKILTLVATNGLKRMQLTSTRPGALGKFGERVTEQSLYVLEADSLTLHQALGDDAQPVPKRLLEPGHPVEGLDGRVSIFQRVKDK